MKNLSSIRVSNPSSGHPVWLRRSILFSAVLLASFQFARAEDRSVAAVQEALKKESFYFGEVTGNLDEPTRAGLRRFQLRNGLPATGEMDTATVQTLNVNSAPSPKAETRERIPNVSGRLTEQNDKAFLNQIEKNESQPAQSPAINTGAPREAQTTANVAEQPQVPAPKTASAEPISRPPEKQKSTPERALEPRRAKAITEKRSEVRKEKEEPVEEGPLDSPGVRIRTFTNTQRERPVQNGPANPPNPPNAPEPAVSRGSTVTTVTTTYTDADGRIHISRKTTTTAPHASKSDSPVDSNEPQTTRPHRFLFWERKGTE